ncbi:TM2 domain-containing protein [uncultured Maricaulis sp.]|uniref:TM2 domain-containing protein n=1 Tax=uncultured Maricaulis sp. TaxID=174710 RepID=UPI0030DAB97A
MTPEQYLMIESRVAAEGKSSGTAFLLWFCLGLFSAHRFYLGRPGTAFLQILAWFCFFFPGLIWWIIDAFLISEMIKRDNERLRARLQSDISMLSAAREPARPAPEKPAIETA